MLGVLFKLLLDRWTNSNCVVLVLSCAIRNHDTWWWWYMIVNIAINKLTFIRHCATGIHQQNVKTGPQCSWSNTQLHGPYGPPSPPWSTFVHNFQSVVTRSGPSKIKVDQEWTKGTGRPMVLGGGPVAFRNTLVYLKSFSWCTQIDRALKNTISSTKSW